MRTLLSRTARLGVLALLVSLMSTLVSGGPAEARSADVDGGTHTLYVGCHNYDFTYVLDYPGAASFDADFELYAPNGDDSSSDYVYGDGDHAEGAGAFNICDYEGTGSYDIEGTVTWYDADYDTIDNESVYGTVRMTKRDTRTTLTVNDRTPRFNATVRFTSFSFDEKPSGWARRDYEPVALDARCPGTSGWTRVGQSKTWTDDRGKAVWRYRWNIHRTCEVRAVTLKSPDSRASTSGVLRINTMGRTAMTARTSTRAPALERSILGR
jgi:hypothetical protein